MPEAEEMLSEIVVGYPVSYLLTIVGIFMVLFIEQTITILFAPDTDRLSKDFSHMTSDLSQSHTDEEALLNNERHESHDHAVLALQALEEAKTFKDLISAYSLEISTAIHSIIIGFDLGILGNNKISTITVLLIVLSFHQFIEGLGLGSMIKTSQDRLGKWKVYSFIILFSATVSLGVIIGMIVRATNQNNGDDDADENRTQDGIVGTVTSIAAGSLLYISLVEMTAVYFNLRELEKKKCMKMIMLMLFFSGVAIMAVIALWA